MKEILTPDAYQRLLRKQETAEKRHADAHTRKHQGHPEHDLQVACVTWFRAQYPMHAKMLFAVPNGGSRNRIEAAKMKAEGVTPGVADLILLEARGGYGALCIEMKTRRKGSGQSDYQKEWQAEALKAGNKYVVCRDLAEFIREVSAYMRESRTLLVVVTGEELEAAQMAAKPHEDGRF